MYFCQMGHNFTYSQPFDQHLQDQLQDQLKLQLQDQDQLQVILMWKNQN